MRETGPQHESGPAPDEDRATPLRVLLVEDSEADAALALREVGRVGPVASERVETAAELHDALTTGAWDLVLCDHGLPRFSAAEALDMVRAVDDEIPFVVLSGMIGEEAAVAALKAGAADVVLKGNLGRLPSVVQRELRAAGDRRLAAQLQRQLERTRRLESLGLLAGGVAHDFNTLLGVILTYARFVETRVQGDEQALADIGAVTEAARQAAQLTRQLLAFGRRELTDPRPLDLDDSVASVERLLRPMVDDRFELTVVRTDGLWPVLADPGQMEQVVLNLAMNARDAVGDGGTVTVTTGNRSADRAAPVGSSDSVDVVRLEVADTGIGMDEATMARAFEPFFTTKATGEGTGLGLATVFGIVEQAGGTVDLRSVAGVGTTVTVSLPARPDLAVAVAADPVPGSPVVSEDVAPREAVVPVGASGAGGGGETILVVEDDGAFREMTRRILAGGGYTVHVADGLDGARAQAAAHDGTIDLLLTDVMMPGGTGVELARALRAEWPGLAVLYMSGHLGPTAAGQVAGTDLLAKPFTELELLDRVRRRLDTRGGPIDG